MVEMLVCEVDFNEAAQKAILLGFSKKSFSPTFLHWGYPNSFQPGGWRQGNYWRIGAKEAEQERHRIKSEGASFQQPGCREERSLHCGAQEPSDTNCTLG